jgi:DNA-binding MarR family transcriptional regulator
MPLSRGAPADAGAPPSPPFVGALLRLCWQRVRRHMNEAIRTEGFTDLPDSHLIFFQYPLPDGVRPSDLARQLRMSRQATNYLIAQMEALGYLERRASTEGERRLVYLTARGWRVVDTIYVSLRALQEQWAEKVGRQRFDDLMEVLRTLAEEDERR